MRRRALLLALPALPVVAGTVPARADDAVRIGYQLIYNPWKTVIATDRLQKATGRNVVYSKFDSGAKALDALQGGRVDVVVMGSGPIVTGLARGIDLQLFWIVADIAAAEALVVRTGSGIDPAKPETLHGKTIGVPFVSTSHFNVLAALDTWGIKPESVTLRDLQPKRIAAAWAKAKIDAAFVWDPALSEIKRSGKVMLTSGDLAAEGKATFDGMVASSTFADANQGFMRDLVAVLDGANAAYHDNKDKWTAGSKPVRQIVDLVGGKAEDVPNVLALYRYPTMKEQAFEEWLGGGAAGGAVEALTATADFLGRQGTIEAPPTNIAEAVTPEFVEAALARKAAPN